MSTPELVAHRGYPAHFPENSLAGIAAAIALGARWLEIDIQLSADGVPVVFHDPTLTRTCGVDGNVFDATFDDLRSLRLAIPEGTAEGEAGIPTLAEVAVMLAAHPELTTFVEIKPHSVDRFGRSVVLETVIDALRSVRERTAIISYLPDVVADARAAGWDRIGLILKTWDQRSEGSTRDLEPDFIFCNVNKLPAEETLSIDVGSLAVYDVTDPQKARTLADRGVELVETFAFGEMLRALRERKKDPS